MLYNIYKQPLIKMINSILSSLMEQESCRDHKRTQSSFWYISTLYILQVYGLC